MGFYLIIAILTTYIAWLYSRARGRDKWFLLALLIILPAILMGMRGVGTDYLGPLNNYQAIANKSYALADYSSLYIIIMRMMYFWGMDYQVFVLLVAILSVGVFVYTLCLYDDGINFPFAIFSYMVLYYQMAFNLSRQILAAEFFLLGIVFLFKFKSKKKYWLCYFLACWIHSSLIPFGLLFFVRGWITDERYRMSRIWSYILCIGVIFSIPLLSQRMDILLKIIPHYGWYITRFKYIPIGVGLFRYLIIAVLPIGYVYVKNKYGECKCMGIHFLPFFATMGFVLWLTSYVSESTMFRLSYNLLIALPILHGYIYKKCNQYNKILIGASMMVTMLAFWYLDSGIRNVGNTIPYQFFWQI